MSYRGERSNDKKNNMMPSVIHIDAIVSKSEERNVCANKNWLSPISFVVKNTRRFYTNDG